MGAIIWGGATIQGAIFRVQLPYGKIVRGGNCPRAIVQGDNNPGGNCPGGNYPVGNCPVAGFLYSNLISM